MVYPYAAAKFMLAQMPLCLRGGAELSRTPTARATVRIESSGSLL